MYLKQNNSIPGLMLKGHKEQFHVDPYCCVGKHTRMVTMVPVSVPLPTVSYRRVLRLNAGDHTTENKLFLNTFRCWISCSSVHVPDVTLCVNKPGPNK